MDDEERRQLDQLSPADSLAIAEAKGRRKVLEELLEKKFGQDAQAWMRKECQPKKN